MKVSVDFSTPLTQREMEPLLACKQEVLLEHIKVPHVLALLTHAELPAQDEGGYEKLLDRLQPVLNKISIDDLDAGVIAACQPTSMINRLQQTKRGRYILYHNCAKVVFFIAQFNQSIVETVVAYLGESYPGSRSVAAAISSDLSSSAYDIFALLAEKPKVAEYAASLGVVGLNVSIQSAKKLGFRAIHVAAQSGRLDLIRGLLRLDPTCHKSHSRKKWTPLHVAAMNDQADAVRMFLDIEASVEMPAEEWDSVIATYHAAAQGGYTEVVRAFIESKLPLQALGEHGCNVLHYAVSADTANAATVKLLLEYKVVDIDSVSSDGRTPLYWALENAPEDCAKELLDNKARVDIASINGDVALHAAARGHCSSSMIGRLLEMYPEAVHIKSTKGATPLHVAADVGAEEAIPILLRYKADVNAQMKVGVTPLYIAVFNKKVGAAKYLLNVPGVALNSVGGKERDTALILAIKTGLLDLAEDLIEAGADVTLCTSSGLSPTSCLLGRMRSVEKSKPLMVSSGVVSAAQKHRFFAGYDAKMVKAQQVLKMLKEAEAKAQMAVVDDVDANAVGADVVDCHMALSPPGR